MHKIFFSKEYREIYIVIFLVLIIRIFIIEPFRIPSGSMQPTLLIGDFIFVNKFIYGINVPFFNKMFFIKNPERGDVVVFKKKSDKRNYIKRIVGIEDDKIVYKNKYLYINNRLIKKRIKCVELYFGKKVELNQNITFKEYLNPRREYFINNYKTNDIQKYNYSNVIVPKNSYFLLGDNRDNSEDSRFWGFINKDQLKGKAFIVWFSLDKKKVDIRWNRLLKYIT